MNTTDILSYYAWSFWYFFNLLTSFIFCILFSHFSLWHRFLLLWLSDQMFSHYTRKTYFVFYPAYKLENISGRKFHCFSQIRFLKLSIFSFPLQKFHFSCLYSNKFYILVSNFLTAFTILCFSIAGVAALIRIKALFWQCCLQLLVLKSS